MVHMRLHGGLGNFEGAALVANNHFLGGITGVGMTAGDQDNSSDENRPGDLLEGTCSHNIYV